MWTRFTDADQYLLAPSFLPKQLPATVLDITSQHLVGALRHPCQVNSTAPVRTRAKLVISHLQRLTYAAKPLPKGDRFSDPVTGTRNQAAANGRPYQKRSEK